MASLPWLWVIEALADLKAADTSVLREAISRVPGFSTEAPETVRERVALRYLEEQCAPSGDVPSVSGTGSGIDVACSSEEILCRKVAAQVNCERDRSELSSHVLRQFILQKKSGLPKSSLDLLKESIKEGRSWNDSSGLCTLNPVDYGQCNNGSNHEHVDTFKLSNSNSQSHSGLQGPVALDVYHGSVDAQGEPSGYEKHLPQENVSDVDMGNKVCGNIVSTGASDAKLLEKGSIHQLSENIGCNGGEIQSVKQADAPALDNSSVSLQDPSASRQNLPELNVSDCERRNSVQQMRQSSPPLLPCSEKTSLQHRPLNASENIATQSNCKNDSFDGEPSVVPETQSEGGVSDDMPFNFDLNDDILTSVKDRLLASQIHANPDSMAGEWSEQGLCIKCDKGGQMLSCSARGCLIAIHESCLSSSDNFKGTGLFYCPFCSYKRASIAYCKARKNIFRARKALSVFIGRDLVRGHPKKLPPASTSGRTSRSGVNENTDHVNSYHSEEYQRKKIDDNPVKSKEQDHGRRDANVCYEHNLSCRYSVPPQSDGRYDVSHNEAELTHCEMVNDHQDNTDMQSLNNVSKTMDTGKLPCGEKVTSPIHQKADAALRQCEEGNDSEFIGLAEHQHLGQPDATTENGNLQHEAMDAYQIRNHDASRAQQKDGLSSVNERAHVEKLKNEEKLRAAPNQDTWREASTSSPCESHAKRRYGVAIGKRHLAQEAVKKTNREKYTSGTSNKRPFMESQQVTASPGNGDHPKALNTQLSERHAKRRRHDSAMHKINDPPETFEKQEREKSSPGRSSKRVAQPKRSYNQRTMLGRRQKLFWTSEEEEILKEAVQRFGDRDGNLPWIRILEFGRHVFHRTRQPGDLKDKWRNIRKKEVKQEM